MYIYIFICIYIYIYIYTYIYIYIYIYVVSTLSINPFPPPSALIRNPWFRCVELNKAGQSVTLRDGVAAGVAVGTKTEGSGAAFDEDCEASGWMPAGEVDLSDVNSYWADLIEEAEHVELQPLCVSEVSIGDIVGGSGKGHDEGRPSAAEADSVISDVGDGDTEMVDVVDGKRKRKPAPRFIEKM
jgi:hypothetical protein